MGVYELEPHSLSSELAQDVSLGHSATLLAVKICVVAGKIG